MSIDVAFSIEIEDFLDADRAYEFFWAGKITDKKAFLCPGENCMAQVTCANLDEESQNMKVVPHFRVYGKHDEQCEIFRKVPLKITELIVSAQAAEKKSVDLSVVDTFSLKRPDSYYESKNSNRDNIEKSVLERKRYITKNTSYNLKQIGTIGKLYSVRTIVGRYLRYISDDSLKNRRINVKGQDIPYSSFLKSVWEQSLKSLPEYDIVYYGWAYVDRYEKGYKIKFKKGFKDNEGKILQASFFVSDKIIDKYPIKNLMIRRLAKISSMAKPTGFVFIYGKPKYFKSPKTGKEYINFDMFNLDFIDINKESPLPTRR
ncbi:hypothetical protein [Photorhabdus cinerea]|uniref:Uncharacterized protein n=1 Tax=Photorhabdus cinerea TaxID=471575 RepID=A0A7X5QD00_9GAMM|nr:hypothetical protein [Photorhabdus cinerea]NHB91977.1 hypothetical protein [Photorhabdus cinerea]